jgi:hypothetical protein
MGSGERRITYERGNGKHMPLDDGRWHQLTMTYSSARSLVRLFYDGDNKASYNVTDSEGFDFGNTHPVSIGWDGPDVEQELKILPAIETGAEKLQELVDAFNDLGLKALEPDEFVHLIVDPQQLYERKLEKASKKQSVDRDPVAEVDWAPISEIEAELMANPYTVHQVLYFMETAPLMKIYALVDGRVVVNPSAAERFAEKERLVPPELEMDELSYPPSF